MTSMKKMITNLFLDKFKVMEVCPKSYSFSGCWTNKSGSKKHISVLPGMGDVNETGHKS